MHAVAVVTEQVILSVPLSAAGSCSVFQLDPGGLHQFWVLDGPEQCANVIWECFSGL